MSPPTSKSGQLWSNCLLDDSIDSVSSDVVSTKLDPRKNNGLEVRGSEQYLTQLLRKKKFVAPRVEKASVENNRGNGRGRGGRGFMRGRGRGRGAVNLPDARDITNEKMMVKDEIITKAQEADVAKGESDLMLDLLAKMQEPKPKTEEEIKKENVNFLGGLFGGTLSWKERGVVKKKGLKGEFSIDTQKPAAASISPSEDAMDFEGQSPSETPKQTTAKKVEAAGKASREIIDYGDLDYDF